MVLILDGKFEIDAYVWSDLSYLICLRHSFRSIVQIHLVFQLRHCLFGFFCLLYTKIEPFMTQIAL